MIISKVFMTLNKLKKIRYRLLIVAYSARKQFEWKLNKVGLVNYIWQIVTQSLFMNGLYFGNNNN